MSILERNFFADPELFHEPAPYYAALHEHGPVFREPHLGVVILSKVDDIFAVNKDHEHFSAIVAATGPLIPVPHPDEGETWAQVIERRRDEIPMGKMLTSIDPPLHTKHRSLLGKVFTPNRLKENKDFMEALADGLIDEIVERGELEFGGGYARPFTLLVIADLLGVPRADHDKFRSWLGGDKGNVGNPEGEHGGDQVFANLQPSFTEYIEARRASPADDVLSRLANARFPDGSLPDVDDVVRIATIIFAAGQETTARLLLTGMRVLAEQPALAAALRADPGKIPNFIEECLRLDGPIKSTFRFALEDTQIRGVDVPAGTIILGSVGAANRDPQIFEDPDRFDAARHNARRNIAFGHGEHFCPGASLARAECCVSFERLLERIDEIELIDPSKLTYAPTFIIRGLNDLPIRYRKRA